MSRNQSRAQEPSEQTADIDLTETVDQDRPTGLELQARDDSQLLIGNGTVFTRIGFSSVTAMSIGRYLEQAKKLRDRVVQVYDVANGMYSMVHRDVALVYDSPVIEQATSADMSRLVNDCAHSVITFSDEYPLLRLCQSSRGGFAVVRVPSRRRLFRHARGTEFEYYPPDLIMRVAFGESGNVKALNVAVMMPGYAHWTRARLMRWPLANVHQSTSVCLGGTTEANRIGNQVTDVQAVVARGVAMFLESRFNDDLMNDTPERLGIRGSRSENDCVAIARAMSEEGAWTSLKYQPVPDTSPFFSEMPSDSEQSTGGED